MERHGHHAICGVEGLPVARVRTSGDAGNTNGYSSTYLAIGFANVREGTRVLTIVAIQKGIRVLISLLDSLMFGRVPGTRPNISESHSEISTRVPVCIESGRCQLCACARPLSAAARSRRGARTTTRHHGNRRQAPHRARHAQAQRAAGCTGAGPARIETHVPALCVAHS